MDIQGRIIAALEPVSGTSARTGNAWAKQEFVLETPGTYPRKCCFTVFGQDRLLSLAEVLSVGNDVTVSVDVDAHEYGGRWYNSITAWKAVLTEQSQAATVPAPPPAEQAPPVPPPEAAAAPAGTLDDLPF